MTIPDARPRTEENSDHNDQEQGEEVDHVEVVAGMDPRQLLPYGLKLLWFAVPIGERSLDITHQPNRPPEQ